MKWMIWILAQQFSCFSYTHQNLQVLFGRYLEERGVNAGLATFLPDYVEYKEQKEYVNWLEKVKGFVSA